MVQVNMLEAKSNLSALVKQLDDGVEDSVVIARNNKPVAVIVSYDSNQAQQRIGIAKGLQLVADGWDLNEGDDEVASLFGVM